MTLGYMAMHNSLWELGFADESSLTRVQKRVMRTVIPLIDVFIMASLAYGYYMDPMNDHLYQNMQLVVISIQLLDDRLTTPEFVTRTLLYAGFVFWSYLAYNHSLPNWSWGGYNWLFLQWCSGECTTAGTMITVQCYRW